MTKKTPKPTQAHLSKLADLMDTRPEGVSLRQVQNTLSVSPTLAKAALIEIGAVEQDGKWVFAEPIAESASEPVAVEPEPLKKLTQAVFDGLPPEYRWAAVDGYNGAANAYVTEPSVMDGDDQFSVAGGDYLFVDDGFDATNWQNSLIERDPVCTTCETKTDIAPLSLTGECQQCYEDATDKAWWDSRGGAAVAPDKSDFALALEAERQRVFDAAALGGTAARIAERTGLPIDDVQMHLDMLIDDGAVVERPIIVAMSYGVAV